MTLSDLARLRHYVDEQDDTTYGDAFLSDIIADSTDLYAAAAEVWRMKAAKFASLVDTAEAGASRRLGQLRDNATAMQKMYADTSAKIQAPAGGFTVTREITRP